METDYKTIMEQLPYTKPFLFVDRLISVSEKGAEGEYTFTKDEYFYRGHFKGYPVTPGVILIECMAQIGVVCLGISLINSLYKEAQIALVGSNVNFYIPVYPGETVRVISEKEYFRFGKLKCKVRMINSRDEVICKGVISGMLVTK